MCEEYKVGERLSAKVRRAFRYPEASRRPPSGSVLMRKARKMFPTFTLLGPYLAMDCLTFLASTTSVALNARSWLVSFRMLNSHPIDEIGHGEVS